MKALLLYDPLFQYLCQVNRWARAGAPLSYGEVRGKITTLLAAVDKKAAEDPYLMDHVRQLKTPVNFFIDDMISQNPKLAFAKRWHSERLGFVKDGLAGDEAFFMNHLDKELKQPPSKAGAERLLVYYVCIGLGFQGCYFNEVERLQAYMKQIITSIRPWLAEDTVERLMPQAYQYTDTRDFVRPPELKKSLMLAGVCCLLLAGLPLYALLARQLVQNLEDQQHLREINESHQGVPWSLSRRK
jgi:type VI protein secretion system component VasF